MPVLASGLGTVGGNVFGVFREAIPEGFRVEETMQEVDLQHRSDLDVSLAEDLPGNRRQQNEQWAKNKSWCGAHS